MISGGVVFAPGSATTGRFGTAVAIGAGGIIPNGLWYVPGAYVVTGPGPTTVTGSAGLCISDGASVTLTAAGNIIPIGA